MQQGAATFPELTDTLYSTGHSDHDKTECSCVWQFAGGTKQGCSMACSAFMKLCDIQLLRAHWS